MSCFVRISNSVSNVRLLFTKMSLSEGVCRVTAASVHTLTSAESGNREAVLSRACPQSLLHVSRRYRNRKILSWPTDYLPYEWSYPPPKDLIAESGDHVHNTDPIELSTPKYGFELSEELQTASPEVKRLFSLELATMREIFHVKKKRFVKLVQRHPYDEYSMEYKIAHKTFRIRRLKEVLAAFPKRKEVKTDLCHAIHSRNKMLKYLRRWDRERFDFVTQKLQISFTPAPLNCLPPPFTKKGDLRRLTKEYCAKMKQDKLDAFHAKLKAERADFLEEKRKTEEWIRSEEERLKLTEEERKSTEYVGILKELKHEA
uniref:Small ribosomal subunit protein uS15m n=1 Tax=Ixodes ricinus TaxID=34613 RepID=V5HR36_IXORI